MYLLEIYHQKVSFIHCGRSITLPVVSLSRLFGTIYLFQGVTGEYTYVYSKHRIPILFYIFNNKVL